MLKNIAILSMCSTALMLPADNLGEIAKTYWTGWQKNKPTIKYPANSTKEQLDKRRTKVLSDIKKYAPHWLDEISSVNKALNWPKGTYEDIVVFGVDYQNGPAPHECTSWIIMPDLTNNKQLILHKNRDSSSRYLVGQFRAVPGKFSWIGHGDYGYIGTNCGINNKSLVVAMNSGDATMENNPSNGLGTTYIARILLEECATAQEAVSLLEKIVKDNAYSHGKSGSMWFIADAKKAFVVENNAKHIHAKEVNRGLAIRGNAWQFPEMVAYSTQKPKDIVGNVRREYAVRQELLHNVAQKGKVISPSDIARASRITQFPEDKDCYPLCGKFTNAAATFVIDQEFPEDLSYVAFAFGPPRHTFYIPVPSTLKTLPHQLLDGTFCNEIFKRKEKDNWLKDSQIEEVESKLNSTFAVALNKARVILKSNSSNAKAEANKVLTEAFLANWQYAIEAGKVDSCNFWQKIFCFWK